MFYKRCIFESRYENLVASDAKCNVLFNLAFKSKHVSTKFLNQMLCCIADLKICTAFNNLVYEIYLQE